MIEKNEILIKTIDKFNKFLEEDFDDFLDKKIKRVVEKHIDIMMTKMVSEIIEKELLNFIKSQLNKRKDEIYEQVMKGINISINEVIEEISNRIVRYKRNY